MEELDQIAHRLGVRIEQWATLRDGKRGDYCHWRHRIRIVWDLPAVQYNSTLAHELGHAYHRHRRTTPQNELQADVYAARVLIQPTCWKATTAAYDDLLTVAEDLGVTPRIAAVYAKHLARHPAIRQH